MPANLNNPLIQQLIRLEETSWFNPNIAPFAEAAGDVGLTATDVADAAARLQRFAPYIQTAFPSTAAAQGIIESPLYPAAALQNALSSHYRQPLSGKLYIKADHQLPISGSIKARGGIYEVLKHAETLALTHDLLQPGDNYSRLHQADARDLFARHTIAVGSTGNLGLSIGIMAATLGFQVAVHMSADARQWKKDKLRACGVQVFEYASDYSVAVAAGRRQAETDPSTYFVDDENSPNLFLGYAVAAQRLQQQFIAQNICVSAKQPLFVYLPCGVGGGPGGVAFGLKLIFGDAVHCFFAEPTHSPCMLLGMHTGLHEHIAVQDIGIDNHTAADGLAVGRPSGFVGRAMHRLIDGCYTLSDNELFRLLTLTAETEQQHIEPSAAAGIAGIARILGDAAQNYRTHMGLTPEILQNATHLIWSTGGSMVPDQEMQTYLDKGRQLLTTHEAT